MKTFLILICLLLAFPSIAFGSSQLNRRATQSLFFQMHAPRIAQVQGRPIQRPRPRLTTPPRFSILPIPLPPQSGGSLREQNRRFVLENYGQCMLHGRN